jgi:HAD superfamily hydrolase (TIGR01509 family)
MNPRPVIFDLDGVLVDSEPLYERAFRAYLDSCGQSEDAALFSVTLGRRRMDFLGELAAHLGHDEGDLARGLDAAEAGFERLVEPMPGGADAVVALRADGRPLALATSSGAEFAAKILLRLGIREHFDAVITGEEVERGKPDPAIYRLAAGRLGVAAESCIAIEDTPVGVASAKAAGMSCVAVPHGLSEAAGLGQADVIADDLSAAVGAARRLDDGQGLGAGSLSRPCG